MTTKPRTLPPLPDPPEREPDDMTSVQHLGETGNLHHLRQYLGNLDTTIVSGERYIIPEPGAPAHRRVYPDLLVSRNADPALYRQDNSYVISSQGKPPDLVMEIASERTGRADVENKPAIYAALGIPEYWRFDETGEHHKTKLAGDRLVDGGYQPIIIDTLPDGRLRGYSPILNLILEWHDGNLNWIDPVTEEHIPTFQQEREAKLQAESRESQEREARLEAEARNRELEAELRRLREHEDQEPPTSTP